MIGLYHHLIVSNQDFIGALLRKFSDQIDSTEVKQESSQADGSKVKQVYFEDESDGEINRVDDDEKERINTLIKKVQATFIGLDVAEFGLSTILGDIHLAKWFLSQIPADQDGKPKNISENPP